MHVSPDHRSSPARAIRRRSRRFPVSLLVIAALVAFFGLVTPSRLPMIFDPASVSLPAPTLLPTAPPAPTDVRGGTIVFTCTRDEINQICMIRADGSGYEQLTSGTANSYYPAISPDGRHIVYAVNLYDTFDLYRLSPGVVEGPRNSESRVKRLTDYIGNAFSPSYSPDGSQIAFLNRVSDGPAELWIMGRDGSEPHAISSPPGALVAAQWSPDGRSIAVASAVLNSFSHEIYVLDLENLAAPPKRIPSTLADLGGSLAWSPDQSNMLVFAGPAAAREIYRLDIATGQATQLTFGGNNASASYSPDGQYVVFNSLRNSGQADLYVMRADGHSMRRLTGNPEPDWQPKWGP